MEKFVRFPVTDVPGFVGFALLVVASIAIVKRVPVIKSWV